MQSIHTTRYLPGPATIACAAVVTLDFTVPVKTFGTASASVLTNVTEALQAGFEGRIFYLHFRRNQAAEFRRKQRNHCPNNERLDIDFSVGR
jgi:hypothetical protein